MLQGAIDFLFVYQNEDGVESVEIHYFSLWKKFLVTCHYLLTFTTKWKSGHCFICIMLNTHSFSVCSLDDLFFNWLF